MHMTVDEFAAHAKISARRVRQLIKQGLPTLKSGKISPGKGDAWIARNLDPQKRAAAKPEASDGLADARTMKLQAEGRLAALKERRLTGELVDRRQVELFLKSRAIFERDHWLATPSAKADELARLVGCDVATAYAALDRIIRDQVSELARTPTPTEYVPDAS